MIALTMSVCSWAEEVDQRVGYDHSDYVEGVRIRYTILKQDIEGEHPWEIDSQPDIKLPVRVAYGLALEFIRVNREIYGDSNGWKFSGATILQIHDTLFPDRFMWLIEFKKISNEKGPGVRVRVPVMLSGKMASCSKSNVEKRPSTPATPSVAP